MSIRPVACGLWWLSLAACAPSRAEDRAASPQVPPTRRVPRAATGSPPGPHRARPRPAPPPAGGVPTGLRDRGVFSSLDGRVRLAVRSDTDPRRTRVVVDKARRLLALLVDGVPVKVYPVALGFAPRGHKHRQGDGRTPEGEYRVVERRHQGLPAKYGARSILLSYPNARDARAGQARGLVTAATAARIVAATRRGARPPQTTPLGGSIRIHGGGIGRDWTLGCIALRDADVTEVYRFVRVGTRVTIASGAGTHPPWPDRDGDGIPDQVDVLLGAHKAALNGARYHGGYYRIRYPGGDVPASVGVCTDVIVRALRNAGLDLQVALQRDRRAHPRRYPGIARPDPNIDHRRVRNLLAWFQAHAQAVGAAPPALRPADLLPGDIVFLDTLPRAGPDHLGIVSDRLGTGGWPQIINNWTDGFHTQAMDLLPAIRVTHHFRLRAFPPTP